MTRLLVDDIRKLNHGISHGLGLNLLMGSSQLISAIQFALPRALRVRVRYKLPCYWLIGDTSRLNVLAGKPLRVVAVPNYLRASFVECAIPIWTCRQAARSLAAGLGVRHLRFCPAFHVPSQPKIQNPSQ